MKSLIWLSIWKRGFDDSWTFACWSMLNFLIQLARSDVVVVGFNKEFPLKRLKKVLSFEEAFKKFNLQSFVTVTDPPHPPSYLKALNEVRGLQKNSKYVKTIIYILGQICQRTKFEKRYRCNFWWGSDILKVVLFYLNLCFKVFGWVAEESKACLRST